MRSYIVPLVLAASLFEAHAFSSPALLPSTRRAAAMSPTALTMQQQTSQRGLDRKSMLDARRAKGEEAAKTSNEQMMATMEAIAKRKEEELAERKAKIGTRTIMERSEERKAVVAAKMEATAEITAKAEADMAQVMKARQAQAEKFDEYYTEFQSKVSELKGKAGSEIRETTTKLRSNTLEKNLEAAASAEKFVPEIFNPASPQKAMSLGMMREGSILASEEALKLPGNKGFDPLGLADADLKSGAKLAAGDDSTLKMMTEAELRHCRAAMLAVVGGPMAPALGLDSNIAMGVMLASFAAFELGFKTGQKKGNFIDKENAIAGDYGFDPLGLYKKMGDDEKFAMRYREINNGRLAMAGIAAYYLQSTLPAFSGNTAKVVTIMSPKWSLY
eukprot:CAMPEP_0184296968 /NCGR_PEP_ID=MMETSP1049-20130417/7909_1 /TAXON_ID=77928 /ORGANISM="Proteomonas sulcata, Strain CCMP704" /LENGTH=388 /DNA_ID=CAMNT_0026606465 /DNA_START=263 /DNA_END=1429 /DNA_ORIENTATION=+